MKKTLMAIATVALALPLFARTVDGTPEVTVLVGGSPLHEYVHRGTTYIEATRGREFTIRLRNPTAQRVAVALSVDGLNTIDAKHTDAWGASKWVLEPYETAEISGWQVSDRAARRFYFTGERDSYGTKLGQTQNLGIIEAVFYRERVPRYSEHRDQRGTLPAPATGSSHARPEASAPPSDDYAATGMGRRTRNRVEEVAIDLERSPIAAVAIRYEFRPQLVKLDVLDRDPLERRERARGFCPER
ncbi:MAG: hypothetical protein ACXW5U_31500 [Thermoanaerobaculia bacterium]